MSFSALLARPPVYRFKSKIVVAYCGLHLQTFCATTAIFMPEVQHLCLIAVTLGRQKLSSGIKVIFLIRLSFGFPIYALKINKQSVHSPAGHSHIWRGHKHFVNAAH